jgi:hypothetical protein
VRTVALVAGIVVVAAHVVGFHYLAQRSRGRELSIDAPPLVGTEGGPGLVHRTWSASYRGGYTRSVGATQLVGPFQDPAAPACSGRVVVGQRMLDQLATVMKEQSDRELRGLSVFPIGDYARIRSLTLGWGKDHVIVRAMLVFSRADVPVTVKLYPQRTASELKFRVVADADLRFGNSVVQWVSDKVGADRIATRVAREQVDDVLVTTFAPPPPFELSEGQTLQFVYCDGPIEIVEGQYGALPFAVAIGRVAAAPQVLPPRFAKGSRPPPASDTTLALDLDVDALDALLYELWRTGWLDKRLAEVGLDRRFNTDPIVTEYLSIRISPLRLALPPVIAPRPDGSLQLAADARVAISDGTRTTIGRVFGALDFRIVPARGSTPGTELPLSVNLGALELACERSATALVPCYGDLVAAIRDRGSEFHGALTQAFATLLSDIFVDRRLSAEGLPVEVVITRAVPSIAAGGTLHLELAAELAPVP